VSSDIASDALNVSENALVREAKDAQLERLQVLLSIRVLVSSSLVDAAIHLDDQPGFLAVEVDNEASDGVLSAKPQTVELFVAQSLPKQIFGRRWFVAHLLRDRTQLRPEVRF
jgi:hypothetical protein